MNKVRITVPATTANLGPGFDCFGCALTLYNVFTFSLRSEGYAFTRCEERFCNADNLAAVSYRAMMDALGLPQDGFAMELEKIDVPISRGLGSSSTMIAAGAYAAAALHGKNICLDTLLAVCTKVEGHPDNLAPALYGGLTASLMAGDLPLTAKFSPDPSLRWIVLIPNFELSTAKARGVLPASVPRQDAIFNLSRAALLPSALERGDEAMIAAAMDDRLHQMQRKVLIPEYDVVEKLAREAGCLGFCLSGAGPTLLALSKDEAFAGVMRRGTENLAGGWRVLELSADTRGIHAEEIA